MTQMPDLLELPEPPRRQRWASVTISWVVIAICVVLMVQHNLAFQKAQTAKTSGTVVKNIPTSAPTHAVTPQTSPVTGSDSQSSITTETVDETESESENNEDLAAAAEEMEQIIVGRYAVGAKMFIKMVDPRKSNEQLNHLQDSIDKEIKTPVGRVRAAIVAGEIIGGGEAAKRLAAIKSDPTLPENVRRAARNLHPIYMGLRPYSSAEESRIVRQWGWYGNLALSFGAPDTDPRRDSAYLAALRTFFTLLFMLLGFFGLLFVGLVLVIIFLVFWLMGKWRWRFTPANPLIRSYSLEVVAAWFVVFLLVGYAIRFGMKMKWGDYHLLAYGVLLAAPLLPLLRGVTWPEWRRALGWHSGSGVLHEVGAGLIGYVAGVPLLAAGIGVTWMIKKWTGANPTHPIVYEIMGSHGHGGKWWWLIIEIFVLAAIWAPLLEETIFRGALYQHLRGWSAAAVAAIINGIIFAVIHPQGFAGMPPLMALAFTFALIREWRGSLIGPMCAHAFNNATLVLMLVLILR